MAVGSNTLGLLFKIGVNAQEAQEALTQLVASSQDVREGMASEMRKVADELDGGLKKVTQSGQQLTVTFNQVRAGVENLFQGDVIEGTTQLTRAFGPLGIAIGAVGAAAVAAGFAIKGAVDAAADIGTKSRDDFDALQQKVQSAGLQITDLQRDLGQGIMGALDEISGATTALFANLIEKSGPALIVALKEISDFIKDTLIPLAQEFGADLNAGIINAIAAWRTLKDALKEPPDTTGPMANIFQWKQLGDAVKEAFSGDIIPPNQQKALDFFTERFAENLKKATAEVKNLKVETATFDPGKPGRAGASPVDQYAKALEAAQKEHDQFLAHLNDQFIKSMEEESKAINKSIIDNQKYFENLKKQWLDYAKFVGREMEQIVETLAQQPQEIPGGGIGIPGLPDPDEVQSQLDTIHESITGFLEDIQKAFESSGTVFSSWGDLAIGILKSFAHAVEESFASFILTGKLSGQVFKQLVAQIIAAVAVEAAIKAIFEVAEGFAALARYDPWAATNHFHSAAVFGLTAAAAGVAGLAIGAAGGLGGGTAGAAAGAGGFGATAAPGTVTVNQGAPATTLGIASQQLAIMSEMNQRLGVLTTAPPGDIVQRGADQNPLAIGQANNEAARRDGTVSRQFLEIAGLRPA